MGSALTRPYATVPGDAAWVVEGALAQSAYQGSLAAAQAGASASVKVLDQKHPDWASKMEAWVDLALLKDSGVLIRKNAARLLQKRPREDPDVYGARIERFTHQPILGTALGWYEAAMYKDDPQFFFFTGKDKQKELSAEASAYYKDEFLSDCDGNRTTFVDFSKRAFADLLAYGVAHTLVDLPSRATNDEELTLQQEKDRGYNKPFLVSYSPLEVINWRCDRRGAYEWVIIKTSRQEQEFLGKPQDVDTWYYFDRTDFKVYEDRRDVGQLNIPSDSSGRVARLTSSGKHALSRVNRVPLRTFCFSNKLWLANRSYLLLRDHLNQDNSLAWALFMSNLAIPIIIGDVDTTNMTAAETGFYQFPAGTEYKWSEPTGNSFQVSAQRLEALREEAFRSMYLQSQGASMKSTPQAQSGRSKLVSMIPTHEVLSGMGNDYRQRLQELLGDVKDARQEVDVEPDVRGFEYEDDMSTEEVFAVSSVLALRVPSDKFERWIYKKIIKAWARDVNQRTLEAMYEEVDAGPTMDDRMEADLKMRMNLMRQGMTKAISGKMGSIPMPPGRGGEGPSPSPTNVTDSSAATL